MVELYILGPAEIKSSEGTVKHSFLAGPKRLALLVYLLLKKPFGFHRRDSLLPLFWPNQGQKSARNSLSNMLYHIRKAIDLHAISNRGSEEVKLNPETFWSDVNAFEQNLQNGMPKKALKLYRGDLLEGFYIPEASTDLDQWLDQERDRFCKMAFNASWTLADQAEETDDFKAAKKWAKKAASFEPLCDKTHGRLIQLLHRTGNQKEAMEAYKGFADRYRKELEVEPPTELTTLAKEVYSKESAAKMPMKENHFDSIKSSTDELKKKIAVLPFENLGLNKNSFFTETVHADLLVRLSKIPDFNITSRTSVMAFKKSNKLLPEIANELGVKWILNGEVNETLGIIQINVQLVNALEDRMVWANIYQRELTAANILQIQAEITKHITQALRTRLADNDNEAIELNSTESFEAFCLHAQGRWCLDKKNREGIEHAIFYFEQALALDRKNFYAWTSLAEAKILLFIYGFASASTAIPEAESALRKVMQLDPESVYTYTTQALLHEAKKQLPEAINKYHQAIFYKPDHAEAYSRLSMTYHLADKSDEAFRFAKKAVKLNPQSTLALFSLCLCRISNRQNKKAILEAKRIQFFQPEWSTGHFLEGVSLYHKGLYLEASKKLQNTIVPWASAGPLFTLALAYIGLEENNLAREIQNQLLQEQEYCGVAMIHAGFKETEESLQILSSIKEWDYWSVLSLHHFYPKIMAPLKGDKRFEKIKQMVMSSFGIDEISE